MRQATRTAYVFLAVTAVSAAVLGPARPAEVTPEPGTRWEYRVLTKDQVLELGKKDLAAGLNTLGEQGWELSAVEPAYIFKRPRPQRPLEELKRRVATAEADLEMQKDRAVWSERMAKRGFLGEEQLRREYERLKDREHTVERARREFQKFSGDTKGSPEKTPKPEQ